MEVADADDDAVIVFGEKKDWHRLKEIGRNATPSRGKNNVVAVMIVVFVIVWFVRNGF